MNSDPQLTATQEALLEEAHTAATNAYTPYSAYQVGAAVHTTTGDVFPGTAVENASYGMTVCAEVSAITAAVSAGHRDISTIAIVGGFPDSTENTYPTPCGRCRQVIQEMDTISDAEITVICSNLSMNDIALFSIDELLPHSFGPSDLDSDDA